MTLNVKTFMQLFPAADTPCLATRFCPAAAVPQRAAPRVFHERVSAWYHARHGAACRAADPEAPFQCCTSVRPTTALLNMRGGIAFPSQARTFCSHPPVPRSAWRWAPCSSCMPACSALAPRGTARRSTRSGTLWRASATGASAPSTCTESILRWCVWSLRCPCFAPDRAWTGRRTPPSPCGARSSSWVRGSLRSTGRVPSGCTRWRAGPAYPAQ